MIYILGILLGLISTVFLNIAPVYQKEGLNQIGKLESKKIWKSTVAMFTNRRWLLGFIAGILAGLAYFIGVSLAGIAVIQPLLNFGIIFLAWLSIKKFNEKIDRNAKIGIIILIMMPLFITLGEVAEPTMFLHPFPLVLFSLVILVLAAVSLVIARKINIFWAPVVGLINSLGATYTQWFTIELFAVPNIFQGASNGLLPLCMLLICNLFGGFYFLNIGLQRNPASRYGPINSTINLICTIFGGIFIFNQNIGNLVFYLIGIVLAVLGIMLLSKFQPDDQKKEKEEEGEIETN